MKKTINIILLLSSICFAQEILDIRMNTEKAAVSLLNNMNFTRFHKSRIFKFLYPSEYDKVSAKHDDFLIHDWQNKAFNEFKQKYKAAESLQLDKLYTIDEEVEYGRYDFNNQDFEILAQNSISYNSMDSYFAGTRHIIVFNNINMRNKIIDKKFRLQFNKEEARIFDKKNPRKILLTYVFDIEKIQMRNAKVFYKPSEGLYLKYYVNVKYIDVKNLSGTKLYKRIELPNIINKSRIKRKVYKNIVGEWIGEYRCSQNITGLTLNIKNNNGKLDGIFSFYPKDKNSNAGVGKYVVFGKINDNGSFKLSPKEWIDKPDGYKMVGLYGKIDIENNKLFGEINSRGCTKFNVQKKDN